jgi:hypothetical protein
MGLMQMKYKISTLLKYSYAAHAAPRPHVAQMLNLSVMLQT